MKTRRSEASKRSVKTICHKNNLDCKRRKFDLHLMRINKN